MAEKSAAIEASIGLITIFPDSSIGKLASVFIEIKAPTPKSNTAQQISSIHPMGSLFEQCLLLTLDCIVIDLMDKLCLNSDKMFIGHANLE